jgi:putative ABC transport system permease protein
MSFGAFVFRSLATHPMRVALTALAIAISIMTVVTMGVLTHSLRQTAINIVSTGSADFTVTEKDLNDVLFSTIDEDAIEDIREMPGVASAIGALITADALDEDRPFFLRIGLESEALDQFGVTIIEGRAFADDAENELILGYRAARSLNLGPGDEVQVDTVLYRIVGLYRTGQVAGDSGAMTSLKSLQAGERRPATVTLGFVKVEPGTDIRVLRDAIEARFPNLGTVQTESEFGNVDRNLKLISAANTGVSILALVIGAITVMNTMMLTVFERTREFGILRAVGWPRWRVLLDVLAESMVVALLGAAAGVALGFGMVQVVKEIPDLTGVFEPVYPDAVFGRALGIAVGMAVVGAAYPAIRAALIVPLAALRHE